MPDTDPQVVLIAIGNSDDKLSQREWVVFQLDVKQAVHNTGALIHGEWHSYPDSIYQNASLCFEIDPEKIPELKGTLAAIAKIHRQHSIAWNDLKATQFLGQMKNRPS